MGAQLVRWALSQAALGACRTPAWRVRRAALLTQRPGAPHAFFQPTVELAATLLRVIGGVWRSGRPYPAGRAGVPVA